jgi:hypothetical protein
VGDRLMFEHIFVAYMAAVLLIGAFACIAE